MLVNIRYIKETLVKLLNINIKLKGKTQQENIIVGTLGRKKKIKQWFTAKIYIKHDEITKTAN